MTDKGPQVRNLIYKNDPLPCEVSETFGTLVDGQPDVEIRLMENQCANRETELLELDFCTELAFATLELDMALPAQSPVRIAFRFTEDGLLAVEAEDLTHGRSLNCRIETASLLDDEEMRAATQRARDVHVTP